MVRRIIVGIMRLALRVFFRRIELAGRERVPREGAVIFVVNHPNGLVDPVFVLCHAPRRVSFLAKAPILRIPVIGWLARQLDALPVYRQQDKGSDTGRNRETFTLCRALLKRGGTIAICPEGVSHNEPRVLPLKSGTARIALGVLGEDPQLELKIVPAGLYYTAKSAFRSAALLYFGEPLRVEPVALEADGEPPRAAVRALSERIAAALRDVTLNAEHEQALNTISRAEKIFSAVGEDESDAEPTLARELDLRRRFLVAYAYYFQHAPARLAELEAHIRAYEEELRQAGVDLDDLSAPGVTARGLARYFALRVVPTLLLAPLALAGVVVHYPAYRLTHWLALKLARTQEDVFATFKIAAALLLFPLTWAACALACWWWLGWPAAVLALALAPVSGFVAIRFFEELDRYVGGGRALLFFFMRRRFFQRLLVERRRLRDEMIALGEEAARAGAPVLSSDQPRAAG
ncbi:MAG TPA: lysophospholipid acyltransferase family protein [Pyrinomonadaceae bacterium]|jgi:1-acyl-sn-glycerol-3-phosphate acyltransferase